ncbi:MAG: signal peptidase I [Bacillota bacterium]
MNQFRAFLKEFIGIVIVAFFLAMILRTFVIEGRWIPSGSMIPTIQVGDRVMVNKFIYHFKEPERGDIVVFEPPAIINQKDDYIKRIIGLPGDTIEVKDGKVWVNGEALNEPYIAETPNYEYGPVKVPEHALFVMGDNRNMSYDSHLWNGWLTEDHIKGKAFLIYWPLNHVKIFD